MYVCIYKYIYSICIYIYIYTCIHIYVYIERLFYIMYMCRES